VGSSTKRRTTAEKRAREQRLLERRKRKEERKAERKLASAAGESDAVESGESAELGEDSLPDSVGASPR
jgi:hypothetical protein